MTTLDTHTGLDQALAEGQDALAALFQDPRSFTFVQAVRILHHAYGADLPIQEFMRRRVRVRPHLSLGFPATDIISLERIQSPSDGRFLLTVSMLGLYGSASPLPAFYTETLLREEAEDRNGIRAFLDVINDAFYGFFLRAGWFRYHMMNAATVQRDPSIRDQIFAPAGLSHEHLRETLSFGLLWPIRISALSLFPRSAAGLASFLSGSLGVPVWVEQCVPRKATVPQDQQCRLSGSHALGHSAILGCQADDATGKIAITLGPMDRKSLLRFTPILPGHEELRKLVSFYCTEPLRFDLCLLLKAQPPPLPGAAHRSTALGQKPFGRLGADAWLALPAGEQGKALFQG